ncbi:39S ribosomal protein L50, mitochondrial-like [Trichosurus vulpecula]|uniref:39S ribosomal protein L50, mitochondrial-like n=1 Tax=Trichosurus vulpecula TaxID=9337 RepID=UPI00186B44E8|nr:39S ribosomal protein L50, mitochondrial-like [Trichosurus vulpecula]
MAAVIGLHLSCRRLARTVLRTPHRALWSQNRKEQEEVKVPEKAVEIKEEPILECPPPLSRKYVPPEDLQSRVESHVRGVFGTCLNNNWQETSLEKSQLKFFLLAQLAEEFGHVVPNSRLHEMRSVKDVIHFYSIPVQDGTKFDEISSRQLPSNLKITWDY